MGNNPWTTKYFSTSIDVGGYQLPTSFGDYWIPDTKRDTAAEPNWEDTNAYTGSYCVWNRDTSNKLVPVYDWPDRSPVHCDADTNFIHVIVRNNGNGIAQGGKLFVYWTINSTNEDWPGSWTGIYEFHNLDTGSPYYDQYKPVGGRINKNGINLDAACQAQHGYPYLDAKGGSHDSVIITYPWVQADTVPKPEWYYHTTGNQKLYSNAIGLCLLARIQTCDSPSYGMTYPEKLNKDSAYYKSSGNIGYNISRNNNIASANYYLDYVKPPFTSDIDDWTLNAVPPLTDDSVTDRMVEWRMCVDDGRYFNNAELYVTIPDNLWAYFDAQNSPGTGWVPVSNNHIIITDPCAVIGPISLPDTFTSALGFTWRFKPGAPQTGTVGKVLFELVQKTDDIETGRTFYGIETIINNGGQGQQGGGAPIKEEQKDASDHSSLNHGLKVSPNPFNQYLDITYTGAPESSVRIEMYDAGGKLVKNICNCKADDKGLVSIRTGTANLASGSYTVRAFENGIMSAEKVIRCE